jgi:hypothetical protein
VLGKLVVRRYLLTLATCQSSMSIDRADFEGLVEADLAELLAGQVPEGLHLDYKRDLYGATDADKREALKDISAFANAAGGHLIIGVDERNGVPVSIPGVAGINPDEIVLRLEQLARTGLEPRIPGLRIRAVALASGTVCFVVRVPRSWNPPHRVSAQNSNRYWIRNSGGAHEASLDELRTLFTQGSTASDRAIEFSDRRLAEIASGRGTRPLQAGGRLIVHVVPLAAVIARINLNLEAVYAAHQSFRPMGSLGMTPRFNLHGFINERGGDQNHGYTQIFRNGIVEATKASIVRDVQGRRVVPGIGVEQQLFEVLPAYINGLRDLGVSAPLVVLITLQGVAGAAYAVRNDPWPEPEPAIDQDTLRLPDCYIQDFGTVDDYRRALRPAIDALWNSAGYSAAQTFDGTGRWVGQRQLG